MFAAALYRPMGLNGSEGEDTWEGKNGSLFVLVSVPRESLRCRSCRCRRVHLHEHRNRCWKAAPLGLTPVLVPMKTPRVKCLSCGSKTWHQPTFAEGQRQVTKEFEWCLEVWLSRLTIQDVVETFGVSWNTVCDLDLRRLKKLARPQLAGLKRLAIDENYLGKTHKYITVVLDLDTRAIVSVAKGRGQAALKGFFSRLKQAGAKIKAVATDMAGGYIAAVMTHLPKAKLVFDHFHVIKLKAHCTGLLNGYDEPIRVPARGCGPLEGINNKIGALQRRAYGYRNYEHLKQRLLTLHHTKFSLVG